MNRKLIVPDMGAIPSDFHMLFSDANIYDSSCSNEAKVFYIEKDAGYFLKCSAKGTLKKEAKLTEYFNKKGLSSEVLKYISNEQDWLLTERVKGEDCTYRLYLDDPKRMCDTIAESLRMLHETDYADCPVSDRTKEYLSFAEYNYKSGNYDKNLFPDNWGYASADEAWQVVENYGKYLRTDTLLHGDYCLPNILLKDWKFSGFIDLGCGGVGDKHIDLFWGAWTLFYNLKTDKYRKRFFDAYGRNDIDVDMLKVIAAIEVFS